MHGEKKNTKRKRKEKTLEEEEGITREGKKVRKDLKEAKESETEMAAVGNQPRQAL
jgi:hypothetical protein